MQRHSIIRGFLFLSLFVLVACFHKTTHAEMLDRIIAVVNDDIITLSELEETGKEYLTRIQRDAPEGEVEATLRQARERLLDKLVNERLITQEAAKANIAVPDAQVEESYARQLEKMGLSQREFAQKLEEAGLSEEQYKLDLRNKLLRDKLIIFEVRSKVVVTEEMMREYYQNEYSTEMEEGGYYLLQIGSTWGGTAQVNQSEDLLEADKARAKKEAKDIWEQAQNGGDFSDLARKHSDLPSAADGGHLGVFQEDDMAPYMRDAILSLDVGEISPIIETPNGYQFFKLLSRESGDGKMRVPFEAVKGEIRDKLEQRNFENIYKQWVKDIKESSYIEIML